MKTQETSHSGPATYTFVVSTHKGPVSYEVAVDSTAPLTDCFQLVVAHSLMTDAPLDDYDPSRDGPIGFYWGQFQLDPSRSLEDQDVPPGQTIEALVDAQVA